MYQNAIGFPDDMTILVHKTELCYRITESRLYGFVSSNRQDKYENISAQLIVLQTSFLK